MRAEEVEFQSEGITLRGDLVLPEGPGPFPAVVFAGGWIYVKEFNLPLYAERCAERGIASLGFDYRNFGASDGQPRQHVNPWEQLEDLQNGLCFLEDRPEVDPDRLGAWGVSYGGTHALVLGAIDPRVRCIVSLVPGPIDGFEWAQRIHGVTNFARFRKLMLEDRRNRFRTGEYGYHPHSGSKEPGVVTVPFDEVQETFLHLKETIPAPRYEPRVTLASTEMLWNYSIYPYVTRLVETPTLMFVAEGDYVTFIDCQIRAFNDIPTTKKKLVTLNENRMKVYRDKTAGDTATAAGVEWLEEHLVNA